AADAQRSRRHARERESQKSLTIERLSAHDDLRTKYANDCGKRVDLAEGAHGLPLHSRWAPCFSAPRSAIFFATLRRNLPLVSRVGGLFYQRRSRGHRKQLNETRTPQLHHARSLDRSGAGAAVVDRTDQ